MTDPREQEFPRDELDALTRAYERTRSESPPPHVDAAVLAHAMRDAARPRRPRRWWIPASVAASALLAVSLVVRIGHETGMAPADQATREPAERMTAPAAVEAAKQSGLPAAGRPEPDVAAAPPVAADAVAVRERGDSAEADAPEPAAVTPAAEPTLRRATESRFEAGAGAAARKSVTGSTSADRLPEPDAWLERIERLDAAGLLEEAAAERAALEAAYPGWLAEHRKNSQ